MFEIGESLRRARQRQGLELSDVERATRIGSRYLAALEEERFDRLPAPAYAKAFLRGYAEFLGLDATLFVDEFDARFAEPERIPPPPTPRWTPPRPSRAGVALTAVGVAALVTILAFAFSGEPKRQAGPPPSPPAKPRPAPRPARRTRTPSPAPGVASLVLTASRGDCWLSVHLDSATGPLLYQGILTTGHSLRFLRDNLWIRLGAPWNLTARLDGAPVTNLPAQTGNVLVTRAGIHLLR